MVYQRTRNSRYAQYSRACDSQGRRAQFSIPVHRTANFNPMIDMLNQGVQMGGDAFQHLGQGIGQAANRFTDIPYQDLGQEIGSKLGGAWDTVSQQGSGMLNGMQDRIGGAVRGVGDYFGNNPQAANAAKAAAGVAGIGAGATGVSRVASRMGRGAAPMIDDAAEIAEQVSRPGFRDRAGAMLKNPKALGMGALGAGGLAAGGYAANRMMNPEEQY
jgi:hypothetical protein